MYVLTEACALPISKLRLGYDEILCVYRYR